jgi:CRISPR system Cascade subunit CasA
MTSFDLVHQAWIPVTAGGVAMEVSLLEALTRADELDGLGLDDPLQAVAVFRQVLLPVVLDAVGAPRSEAEWAGRWQDGRLDPVRIGEYLAEHAHRFDLFHATAPFAQVAGLHTAKNETKPVSVLLPAVAAGNNVPLFSATTDGAPPTLTPAAASRALLSAHCWDTAAIKSGAVGDPQVKNGKTTGNPPGPLGGLGVTVPLGANLAQTLLLNLPIVRQGLREQDRPQWRADPAAPTWSHRAAVGLLDLLTFQARRIRLVPQTDADRQTRVRQVVLAAGDRLDHHPDIEPHTMWRQEKKPQPGAPARTPVRHQPGRAAWRGLSSLLATATPTQDGISTSLLLDQIASLRGQGFLPNTLALQVLTAGVVYGNQRAVYEDVLTDLIPLPVLALSADSSLRGFLEEVVDQAERLRRAGNDLGDDIRLAAGGEKLPWDKSLRVGDALVHQLTPTVHRLLAGLQRDPDRIDDADDAWQQVARRTALAAGEEAAAAAPPQAFLGRPASGSGRGAGGGHRLSTAEARYRAAVHAVLPRHVEPALVGGPA